MTCQPQEYSRLLHFQIIFFLCRYNLKRNSPFLLKYVIFYRSVIESWAEIVMTFGQFFKLCRKGSIRNLILSSTMILILLSGKLIVSRQNPYNYTQPPKVFSFLCPGCRLCSDLCLLCLHSITAFMDSCW